MKACCCLNRLRGATSFDYRSILNCLSNSFHRCHSVINATADAVNDLDLGREDRDD